MKIFNIDSPFYKFGEKVFDLIIINFLFLVTSVLGLGFTFGSSLTAMFYAINKTMRKEEGYVFQNYFNSFKVNFKQSIFIWIILYLGYYIVLFSLKNTNFYGNISGIITPILYFFLCELLLLTIFVFPLLAKVELSTKDLLKKSLFLAHKHLFTSITCASVVVLMYFLVSKVHPIFIIIAFSLPGYLISRLVYENVIMKYIPKEKLEEAGEHY